AAPNVRACRRRGAPTTAPRPRRERRRLPARMLGGEETTEERGELGYRELARGGGGVADVAVRQEGAGGGENQARERARGARGERHDAARAGEERDLEQHAQVAEVARVGDELRHVGAQRLGAI